MSNQQLDERVQAVSIVNTSEVARAVVWRLWWLWAIPLLIAAVLGVAAWQANRSDDDDARRDAETERSARQSSEPFEGDGYRFANTYCHYSEDSATYSGTLTNTSTETRSYSMTVTITDENGVRIGETGDSVSELAAGSSANLSATTGLTRFVDGPPASKCSAAVERTDFTVPSLDLSDLLTPTTGG
jgi:hypothetical protein